MPHQATLFALAAVALLAFATASAFADKGHHSKPQRIKISVTTDGFVPGDIKVKSGASVVLSVTRKTDKTCATSLVVQVSKTKKIEKELPLNKTIEIPVVFEKSGKLSYACGMGHVSGVILVQ